MKSYERPLRTPELIPADTAVERLENDVNAASHSVDLQTMVIDKQQGMQRLLPAMKAASARDVHISLGYDWLNYAERPLQTRRLEREAAESDVQIHKVGHPWLGVPIVRRSHIKLYNMDAVSYIGGVNLSDRNFASRDLLLRYENERFAAIVREVQENSRQKTPSEDTMYQIDEANTLLVDGGRNGHSIILDQAVESVETAEQVWYLSQYAPSRRLGRRIARVATSQVKYNTWRSWPTISAKLIGIIDRMQSNVPNTYDGNQSVHAKILVMRHLDEGYTSFMGSHNFAATGVLFGTREVALKSHDPALARQLIDYIEAA